MYPVNNKYLNKKHNPMQQLLTTNPPHPQDINPTTPQLTSVTPMPSQPRRQEESNLPLITNNINPAIHPMQANLAQTQTPRWDQPFDRPDWFSNYRLWRSLKQSNEWSPRGVDPSWVMQGWRRSPDLGDYVIYHPYWGWQDFNQVANLYKEYGKPMTWEDFTKLPLTKQFGEDWRQFFPNRKISPSGGNPYQDGSSPYQGLPVTPAETPEIQPIDPKQATSMLDLFGYLGPIDLNPAEREAIGFARNYMYGDRKALEPLNKANNFLNWVIGGGFSPQGHKFRNEVYDATRDTALEDLERTQKLLATKFSNYGGYFGGRHALSQALLADKTLGGLRQTLADLNLSGFNQDVNTRMGASQGLTGLGLAKSSVGKDILNSLLSVGDMMTRREMINRGEYQSAMERAYNDWMRARQEQLLPFQLGLGLLGLQPVSPIAQQPQQSPWNALLSGLGYGAGRGLTSWITGKL